jgi:putative molybdopterin biosynthesis protein
MGAAELAKVVGVSRQTIYAIETGTYVPNTEVALRLARALEITVDELFRLEEPVTAGPETITADVLSSEKPTAGQAVRVCQMGAKWVSVPVSASPYYMPLADGVVRRAGRGRADLVVFGKEEAGQKKLVLAGCDPATSFLSHMVERASGVEIVAAAGSSKLALKWLKEGTVHIAGSHLEDPQTGEFNLPFLRKEFAGEELTVVTFARWEEGLVLAPGNPKKVRGVEDLARADVRFINREVGSGSRGLAEQLLASAGMKPAQVPGFARTGYGHLAVAYSVLAGEADVCLATRSAARAFGLDFLALRSERYDLVMRRKTAELPAAQAFLDVLQRASLRRKLETLAGYETTETGTVIR